MSNRKLNDWLEGFLQYTNNSEAPYSYRLWTGISVLAAALERKVWFEWEKRQYPNMYIILVGPPGVRKGTAITPAEQFLRKINVKLASETVTREALIMELAKSKNALRVPRIPPHCSLTVFSEELTVFLGYQNTQMIADLTAWFDCKDDWTYSTKTEELRSAVTGVWVNLLGATTPRMIQLSMPIDAIGGGLISRMIFVYENERAPDVIFPFRTPEQRELEATLEDDLVIINSEIEGEFRFHEAMLNRYAEWRTGDRGDQFIGTQFEQYVNRRPIHHLKLSIILSASRSSEQVVREEDFLRARAIMERTEKKMVYTFSGIGSRPDAEVVSKMLSVIYKKGKIRWSELIEIMQYDTTPIKLREMIESVRLYKKITIEYIEGEKEDYYINYIYGEKDK